MFSSDYLYNVLKSGVSVVTFTKVDGTTRRMRCTLNNTFLPDDHQGKGEMLTEDVRTLRVFDLDVNGWRSFRVDSVTNVQESSGLING